MKYENRRLTVGISKTINLGNYESIKVHTGIAVDISNSADVDEAYNDLFEECTGQVLMYEEEFLGGEKK
ncbi:MAG: hypothetical protein DRO67_00470 [Candidatus Asgardarchaeum californiense]|nr:MAG: hypothetical protein DRO67_00470 [Candidatus Asgardarchaeum californiense]